MNYDIKLDTALEACMHGDFFEGERIAFDIITEFGWIERAIHLILCILSCTEQRERAVSLLNDLVRNKVWLNPSELKEDHDLDAIRSLREFNELQCFSECMYEVESERARTEILIMCGDRPMNDPIYFFPGRGAKAEEFIADFGVVFEEKQIYYVQSGQVYSANRFCWDNEDLSLKSIEAVLNESCSEKKLVSGVSQGARMLIRAFACGLIKDDLLLFIPAITDKEIRLVCNSNIRYEGRITVVTGECDACYLYVKKLINVLADRGFNINFCVVKGMGHYILSDEIRSQLTNIGFYK